MLPESTTHGVSSGVEEKPIAIMTDVWVDVAALLLPPLFVAITVERIVLPTSVSVKR